MNVIALSSSDGEAFDRGWGIWPRGFWPHRALQLGGGGVWPGGPKTGGFWPGAIDLYPYEVSGLSTSVKVSVGLSVGLWCHRYDIFACIGQSIDNSRSISCAISVDRDIENWLTTQAPRPSKIYHPHYFVFLLRVSMQCMQCSMFSVHLSVQCW